MARFNRSDRIFRASAAGGLPWPILAPVRRSTSPLDYWAVDCAVNPWRKGCKDFDV